jgi:uncharacterized membrane protein
VALTFGAAAVWTAVVGGLAVWRHLGFLSHLADLGTMAQAVWSTSQGRVLEITDSRTGEQAIRLAGHVDPILVLYTPFWWIHPAPETLILVQAAVLSSGVYPVVRLALKHTESRLAAALLGAWYLCIPWIVWLAFNELNPLSLALPLLLYAIWFLDEHRLGLLAVAAGLALLTGELVGVTVALLGLWYAITYRRVRSGLAVMVAGIGWTALCLYVVIPAFNDGSSSRFYSLFEGVGGSPWGLVETLFTDPGSVITQMTSSGDIQYVLWLIAPTALLFLGQPLLLLAAGPQLGVNLLSEFPASVSPLYHYSAPVVAVFVSASIVALGRLPQRFRTPVAAIPLLLAVVLLVSIPPVPGQEAYLFPKSETGARTAAMRRAVDLVPPSAPITVTNHVGAHLSARRVVYAFPQREHATWAVVDVDDVPLSRMTEERFRSEVRRLDRDPSWRLVFASEGVRVYSTPAESSPG